MRIVVASARRARFASSTIIRKRSARSCEAASRPAIPRTVSSRSASSASRARPDGAGASAMGAGGAAGRTGPSRLGSGDPADERREQPAPTSRVRVRGVRRRPVLGRSDRDRDWARAHVPMVAPRHRPRRRHRSWSRVGPSSEVTSQATPDPLTARAWPDYTPAASRPLVATIVRSRIRGQHNPWTTVPVPSTASRAVITRNPLRPAS